MNRIILVLIFLVSTVLSYVVYAVTQESDERQSASEVIAQIVNPNHDLPVEIELAPPVIAVRSLQKRSRSHESVSKSCLPNLDNREKSIDLFEHETKPCELSIRAVAENEGGSFQNIEITFKNTSDQPFKIIKPLDGSFYGWYQPHYKFTVENSAGEKLGLQGRCGLSGLWANTTFPESYLTEIEPNGSHQVNGYLPVQVDETGKHMVSFEYIYQFKADKANQETELQNQKAAGSEFAQPLEGVWQGVLKSNSIEVMLKKNN